VAESEGSPRRADELDLAFVDLTSKEFEADPAGVFDRARRGGWLARTADGYAVLGHAQARAVLRHPQIRFTFSHVTREASAFLYDRTRADIQALHGPDHTRLRGVAVRALRARVVDNLRDGMRRVVEELLDGALSGGVCDLVPAFVDRYPVRVMGPILGVPEEDCPRIDAWVSDVLRIFDAPRFPQQAARVEAGWRALEEYLGALLAERERAPGDDLYSELVRAVVQSGRLERSELVMLARAMTGAALDTTRGQLGLTLECLVRRPDQWQLIVRDRDLAPRAVEEGLRFAPAISGIPHVAADDVEIDGVLFSAGTVLIVHPRATNRDPSAFEDPDRFDVEREPAQHYTFGFGPHACVGATLARAELEEALRALAARVGRLELAGDVRRQPYSSNGNLLSLPVRFQALAAA
jgi:cytochrome P450